MDSEHDYGLDYELDFELHGQQNIRTNLVFQNFPALPTIQFFDCFQSCTKVRFYTDSYAFFLA